MRILEKILLFLATLVITSWIYTESQKTKARISSKQNVNDSVPSELQKLPIVLTRR